MTVRKVRRAQTVSPLGVGAIIDLVGESFVAEDASTWGGKREFITMPRLAGYLKVKELRTAPAGGSVPYYRFPQWLFCPACRRMERWSIGREKKGATPRCENCRAKSQLVPMRFVAVCGRGHLSDVDWRRWAHSAAKAGERGTCKDSKLTFETSGAVGGGLESTEVKCGACGASRSLEGLPHKDSLRRIGQRCTGRQPWQIDADAVKCEEEVDAVQRGASSVYFPEIVSAIDIPPDSNWSVVNSPVAKLKADASFQWVLSNPGHTFVPTMLAEAANTTGVSLHEAEIALAQVLGDETPTTSVGSVEDITPGEWLALTGPPENPDPRDFFIGEKKAIDPAAVSGRLEDVASQLAHVAYEVTLVKRLREVRALRGFKRHTSKQMVPANLDAYPQFLPAVEVFGEGFFVRFNENALASWERGLAVVGRGDRLKKRKEQHVELGWLPEPTPRFVLLHTFAHLLLRQTAFEAGYSSSSLRERLYVTGPDGNPKMAGVLIYTAAGDTEGTLGGLVRLGEPERLVPLVCAALASARWCSFDPVCGESSGQGPGGLSLAACHACSLLPETSCVASNRLLDRRLVIDEELGFFRHVQAAIEGVYDSSSL
ncbi:DUF1998 domain-containing protein [Protofrankia symbiont of Coriaria ruscifolia]|uniref:DUF1998 domain-containing protein n=1 Tax=Protofrankia symbiont of Coriaria ruscifolia TaxID=1306542 RepID=UPI0010411919|nr:DUF1998 domain-containing protein [Protofrankia symbiont of Coriaria ruscifolia]